MSPTISCLVAYPASFPENCSVQLGGGDLEWVVLCCNSLPNCCWNIRIVFLNLRRDAHYLSWMFHAVMFCRNDRRWCQLSYLIFSGINPDQSIDEDTKNFLTWAKFLFQQENIYPCLLEMNVYIYSWSLNVIKVTYLIQSYSDLSLSLLQIMESKR